MKTVTLEVGPSAVVAGHATGIWSRFWGLMGRRGMPQGIDGILFPGCSSIHTIGMRFPLDVVFLREGTVTRVVSHVPPWRMVFGGRGVDALELEAGAAEVLGLAPGVSVAFRMPVPGHAVGEAS